MAKSEAITACMPSMPEIPIPTSAVWIMLTSLAPSPIAKVCTPNSCLTIWTVKEKKIVNCRIKQDWKGFWYNRLRNEWRSDDYMMTAWWLTDDCLMTAWWLPVQASETACRCAQPKNQIKSFLWSLLTTSLFEKWVHKSKWQFFVKFWPNWRNKSSIWSHKKYPEQNFIVFLTY